MAKTIQTQGPFFLAYIRKTSYLEVEYELGVKSEDCSVWEKGLLGCQCNEMAAIKTKHHYLGSRGTTLDGEEEIGKNSRMRSIEYFSQQKWSGGVKKPLPADALLLDPGEPRPLMVSRQEAHKIFIGLCGQTLANLGARGEGPPYFRRGKICWYRVSDIEKWLTTNPIQTSEGIN